MASELGCAGARDGARPGAAAGGHQQAGGQSHTPTDKGEENNFSKLKQFITEQRMTLFKV